MEPVDPVVDALRLQFRVAFRDIAAGAIDAGVAAGELPAQDAAVVAAALVGAIGEALAGPLGGRAGSRDRPHARHVRPAIDRSPRCRPRMT